METPAIVDWVAEAGLDRDDRHPVDDWTAGEDLDFAVREPRRRRTAAPEAGAVSTPEPDLDAELVALTSELEAAEPVAEIRPELEPRVRPGVSGRRTVSITGRPEALRDVPRLREVERRRPTRRPADRVASRPDRIAMWAVVLGFVLILIASISTP